MQTQPSGESSPQERIRTIPVINPKERGKRNLEAAIARRKVEVSLTKTANYDAKALAKLQAEKDQVDIKRVQHELDTATWDGPHDTEPMMRVVESPHDTEPMMPVVEHDTEPMMKVAKSHLTNMDRVLGEAKGLEEQLKSAGIDPDELAAGKVGLWKRLTHSQLIHDWREANDAVIKLAPKTGVERGGRTRLSPPKTPRSPLGLG